MCNYLYNVSYVFRINYVQWNIFIIGKIYKKFQSTLQASVSLFLAFFYKTN